MPSYKQVMIGVRPETRARLRAFAESVIAAHESGLRPGLVVDSEAINPAGCGLSMDAVINLLIDEIEKKRIAARVSAAKRKKAK